MTDLGKYRVACDEPSTDAPITALVCEICGQHGGSSDVRWWPKDYQPTIPELIAEAERHESKGHRL
ncbi:hypothetical protein [Streptomyces flavofungini]|uniref:hypothetical protein n=1 Tax=Streptomyces flavofungini TaxID=68200 RepID=UPI0034DFD7A3